MKPAHTQWRWSREDLVRLAVMREYEMTWDEIAQALGRSVYAVKQAHRPLAGDDVPAMLPETQAQSAMWVKLLAGARL